MDPISTRGLTKRYAETAVLEDLDLSIPAGTVYGYLGPNGAGKTTTLRLLTGLIRPTRGNASVGGVPTTDRDGLLDRIGYLPQESPLFRELTAYEQLDLAARLRDIPPRDASERIDALLERLGLRSAADERIAEYSTGMRRGISFAQAILHEPDILLLDEPTVGLDPRRARTVRELIAERATDGTTVFLSSHRLSIVEELADTVGVLYDGRLVAEGPPDELARRAATGRSGTLEDAFLELTDETTAAERWRQDG